MGTSNGRKPTSTPNRQPGRNIRGPFWPPSYTNGNPRLFRHCHLALESSNFWTSIVPLPTHTCRSAPVPATTTPRSNSHETSAP
eukprot:scaffold342213_cov38-Prasinocladus_malaysianus.AAC.2